MAHSTALHRPHVDLKPSVNRECRSINILIIEVPGPPLSLLVGVCIANKEESTASQYSRFTPIYRFDVSIRK